MNATEPRASVETPLAGALWLAEREFVVFAADHPGAERCAGIGQGHDPDTCTDRGKHPAEPFTRATRRDEQHVRRLFSGAPRNVGVYVGGCAGPNGEQLLVMDSDRPRALEDTAGALGHVHAPTMRVHTAKGHHDYYWAPAEAKLGNGLGALKGKFDGDVRAGNAYVIGLGSVHATGVVYTLEDHEQPPVMAPAWLLEALQARASVPAGPATNIVIPSDRHDAYTRKVVQAECDAITRAANGEQNTAINTAAFSLGTLVGAGALSEGEARETLLSAARAGNHPEGRALATIESGLRAGMAQPRHPWPPVARADTRNDFSGLVVPEPRTEPVAPASPVERARPEEPSENPMQARLAELRAALVDSAGLDGIADPVPLIDGVLYMDSLAWLYGKPGSAKSFVALDWAGCIGSGLPWQYRSVSTGPVLYLVAEGASGIRKRVRAWEEAFRVTMQNVTFLPMAVQLLNGIDRQALVALIKEMAPALVIIDTQARVTVGADENSNGEMSKVVDAADQIRQACGACVLMVHHSGKNGLDMRGASAFEGAATSVIKVTKDGEYVEVHSDKQKDEDAFETVWLRLTPVGQSVVLAARSMTPSGDEMTKNEEVILAAMRDSFETTSATATNLMAVTDVPKASVYRALNSLVNRGSLRNIGTEKRPIYALPAAARESP
ncbi:AAA family ATPase [Streptomyces sp. NPDC059957]|uniref:AAA family ATPase n=1 Tax=unclassified Streptomyces TaxID=2593676 RepID=UPI00365A6425